MLPQQPLGLDHELEQWASQASTTRQDAMFLEYLAAAHGILRVADSVRRWLRRHDETAATHDSADDSRQRQLRDAADAVFLKHGIADCGALLEQADDDPITGAAPAAASQP